MAVQNLMQKRADERQQLYKQQQQRVQRSLHEEFFSFLPQQFDTFARAGTIRRDLAYHSLLS